ncbi:uncharacterized protein LOC119073641 isoform X3 [Bradysia coprophila]|uniref:uncharacterized protein LOC119073641 isoform X3 n=1 Tax=Bradysia coprophila TaxID=38358 RepID=UPI00187DBCC2|nr:uncharacterized protein LOC119073641 isoform X3 [Bradysia coprophila]
MSRFTRFADSSQFLRKMSLFDFTSLRSVDGWTEISDTVRTVGKSKATLVLQKTQLFQNAVFFSLLHPQPNGACFAGVRIPVEMNLSEYEKILIRCRGEGENTRYKIVLRHNGQLANDEITYERVFMVGLSDSEFSDVRLKLTDFKPFYRGREMPDVEPLNTSNITSFGIQIFGGVYSEFKQAGVSALVVEEISAV